MVESWLLEGARAVGRFFLNPTLYWFIFILTVASYFRIKRERQDFGIKVYQKFIEWKGTLVVSLLTGIVVSVVVVGTGMVFSYEVLFLLAIVTIILSISTKFTLLSPSYIIGMTFLLLLVIPPILEMQSQINYNFDYGLSFKSLAVIGALLLIVESILIQRIQKQATFPRISLSDRGIWVGQHQVKRLALIPLLVLVPEGLITSFAPWWPYLSIGETSLGLAFVPFIIGFDYTAKGHYHLDAIKKVSKANYILAIGILMVAVAGIFVPYLSLTSVILAIIGKEYLNYRYREGDRLRRPYYQPHDQGLRVVSVLPNSPADRLEISPGESIYRVNGRKVTNSQSFYEALQGNGAFIKLEIIDYQQEIRLVQGSLYEGEHHALGLLFPKEPFKQKKKQTS